MDRDFELPNETVRLKRCRYGPMLYLANDLYVGRSLDRYGEWSDGEMVLLRQVVRPGHIVLDIGANIGTHTVFFAKAVGVDGAVLAFEPQRTIFQILCANVALNGLVNVYARHAAVGSRTQSIRVPQLDVARPHNFGALSLLGGPDEGELVDLVPIDSLELRACHVMKIDVEGMESEVIRGAMSTLRRFRPILYVENEQRERSAELIHELLELDYRLYRHTLPMFNPDNHFGDTENVFGNTCSFNVVGVHRCVSQSIRGLDEITSPSE